MPLFPLPDDWPRHRDTLQRLAAHVVGQARLRHDGLFDLVPLPGGFGTPAVGSERQRVRIVGGSLFVETVVGHDVRELTATTRVATIAGATIAELCAVVGFEPDPEFWVGDDTPELGDVDEPLALDAGAADALGAWYLLGQQAIDATVASLPDAEASVGRLWPEHFDFGIDLAAAPDVRLNLGAAAGDGFATEPYLYVGPWDAARPGDADYWNAPFGALLPFADVMGAPSPLHAATEFLLQGVAFLRA